MTQQHSSPNSLEPDPRLRNSSPNIVAAPHVDTELSDFWSMVEIEGHTTTLYEYANRRLGYRGLGYPYCEVA